MPHLVTRNIKPSDVASIWDNVKEVLCKACDCAEDWFTVEALETKAITEVPAIVEITWFERTEAKQAIVDALTDQIKPLGFSEVTIIFKPVEGKNYFENKKSF